MPPGKSVYLKIIFILNQNLCFGYSKEPSQWDGSFEYLKHIYDKEENNNNFMFKKCFFSTLW